MGIYDELSKLSENPARPAVPEVKEEQGKKVVSTTDQKPRTREAVKPRKHGVMTPSNRDTMQPSNHDVTTARYHESITELVRRAVKEFGKEGATHRFTTQEKKALVDIIYAYKGRGVRTNENEITRIAVNFIIYDYQENGENSVLDTVLKALNS